MTTFLLTWNPDTQGWPDVDYEAAAEQAAAGGQPADRWSVGIRKRVISIGDRAYLLRQRREGGIVASGWFTSEISPHERWTAAARQRPTPTSNSTKSCPLPTDWPLKC
jgi:5-methylcytosine-specific restriction enzyme A